MIAELIKIVPWIVGFLTGAAWSAVNFWLIIAILKIALLLKDKRRLSLLLLVKFPLLYTLGFFILYSRFFPVYSVLAGASLIFIVIGAVKVCRKAP